MLIDEIDKVYEISPEQVSIIKEMTEINVEHGFMSDISISPDGFVIGNVILPVMFFEYIREFISIGE
jgi:hypothetical protein